MKNYLIYLLGSVLGAFGLLTIFKGGSVIFDLFGARTQPGNFVPFIVWTNFLAGISYLFAAYGYFTKKRWTALLLGIATLAIAAAFVGLFLHINAGGLHEIKTVGAMVFRTTLTLIFTIIAYLTFNKKTK